MTSEPTIFQQHTQCVIDLHNEGSFSSAARIRSEANRVAALEARVEELESLLGDHLP